MLSYISHPLTTQQISCLDLSFPSPLLGHKVFGCGGVREGGQLSVPLLWYRRAWTSKRQIKGRSIFIRSVLQMAATMYLSVFVSTQIWNELRRTEACHLSRPIHQEDTTRISPTMSLSFYFRHPQPRWMNPLPQDDGRTPRATERWHWQINNNNKKENEEDENEEERKPRTMASTYHSVGSN
ncbi:hypothetical protein CEXT_354491 [Caerostris extrusa]|uniref:Uncharacterized protein n=1 Tax=Caerostris extrusa TaxID=172846 RepID=A0AAV4XBR9_CAEEX|nr:hypothetical protein CEXT_354491 [Caerostris extrusa]